jgi:hypothetical protein
MASQEPISTSLCAGDHPLEEEKMEELSLSDAES